MDENCLCRELGRSRIKSYIGVTLPYFRFAGEVGNPGKLEVHDGLLFRCRGIRHQLQLL